MSQKEEINFVETEDHHISLSRWKRIEEEREIRHALREEKKQKVRRPKRSEFDSR